jgi:hypothetical protein
MVWARSELNSGALQNAGDVIQPKPVLPDFALGKGGWPSHFAWLTGALRICPVHLT